MTDTPAVAAVARNLTLISELYEQLLVQAIHKANDRLMPGGEAMVALGPAARPSLWEGVIEAAEHWHIANCDRLDHTRCRYAEHVSDQEGEPILQTLLFWSEAWRAEDGYEVDRASVRTEVNYIRQRLDWAWRNLPEFADFADDIKGARIRLENLLYAGERALQGAPCLYDECGGARVIRKMEPYRDEAGEKAWRWSNWHCPKCKRSWDEDRYAANIAAAHWSAQAEIIDGLTWCSVKYASRQSGVPESTIRAWVTQTKAQQRPIDASYPIATACVVLGRRVGFVCLEQVMARRDRPRRGSAA